MRCPHNQIRLSSVWFVLVLTVYKSTIANQTLFLLFSQITCVASASSATVLKDCLQSLVNFLSSLVKSLPRCVKVFSYLQCLVCLNRTLVHFPLGAIRLCRCERSNLGATQNNHTETLWRTWSWGLDPTKLPGVRCKFELKNLAVKWTYIHSVLL